MKYPTKQQVETANQVQLGEWLRFLPSPGVSDLGNEKVREEEAAILDQIRLKFQGWTPQLSKQVGWDR